jgi:hypothetical protein
LPGKPVKAWSDMNKCQLVSSAFIIIVSTILTSCGPGKLFGPTLTPTITPVIIKEGEWSNKSNSLTFTVMGNKIKNLIFELEMNQNICEANIDEINISETLYIKYELWAEDHITQNGYDLMEKYGIPRPASKYIDDVKNINTFTILGSFNNSTSVSGTYHLAICGDSIGNVNEGWSAKWNG